jgi:hypothetical protein
MSHKSYEAISYLLPGMGHGHLFSSLGRDLSRGNRVHPLERVGRVVTIATLVTDPDHYVLKDHKARFVLESFALYLLLSNRSLAVLAPISELIRHISGSVTLWTVTMSAWTVISLAVIGPLEAGSGAACC